MTWLTICHLMKTSLIRENPLIKMIKFKILKIKILRCSRLNRKFKSVSSLNLEKLPRNIIQLNRKKHYQRKLHKKICDIFSYAQGLNEKSILFEKNII